MRGPVRNAGFLFAGEAASRVFGFLTTAVLARRLGVDGFGQIGFAAAVMAYGVVLTDIGLVTVGTRSVARDRSAVPSMVGTVVPLRLVLGLAAGLVMVLIALVLPKPAAVKWPAGPVRHRGRRPEPRRSNGSSSASRRWLSSHCPAS